MNRLKRALLAGTALITLYAGILGACKREYNTTPTEPTPVHTVSPTATPTQSIDDIVTPTPATPQATATIPNSAYDFGKSLGLEANYLRGLNFDNNTKEFISYLASMPAQMRGIAERSGLIDKLIADKQVNADEQAYFKKIVESYQKDIEMMKPWLTRQLPDEQVNAALALNLTNAIKYNQFASLPNALFTADGVKRMYAAEINDPVGWRSSPKKVYTSTMIDNITNFETIRATALEVANDPKYDIFIGKDARRHFELEAVGSTDAGLNAYEDISILVREGSSEAKAALRIYAWNLGEGKKGSAPQVRVELTEIDLWSIGIPSYLVVLQGHDVPTIPLTLDDIALLKSRSADPLFILDIDGKYHLPFQWTRTSIIRQDVTYFTIPDGIGRKEFKIADLKPY